MKKLILPLGVVAMLASCAPRPYVATNMYQSTSKHKTVAVLPPVVDMQLRPRQMERTSPEQLKRMEQETSWGIQQAMYSWLLRKHGKMNYSVQFQDISKTNATLKNANINYDALRTMDPTEVAKVLGVDAVIDMNVHTDKPVSEGVAITTQLLQGTWVGPTNHTMVVTNIHDGSTGSLLWKLEREANGNAGSTPEQLIKMTMKRTARKFPYRRTKMDAAGNRESKYAKAD